MPFTSNLISSSGMFFENIAVGYCIPHPPTTVDPSSGVGQRRFEDSWLEMVFPLADNVNLRESMVRVDGRNIRYGMLFEILDALAADVAYRHTGGLHDKSNPTTIVTASVDGLHAFKYINAFEDLKLQGYISYTGSSSMEVCIDILSVSPEGVDKVVGKILFREIHFTRFLSLGNTQFIMVARSKEGKATKVHGLSLEGEQESEIKQRFEAGRMRVQQRKERSTHSLSISAPSPEEVEVMHKLFIESNGLKAQKDKILSGRIDSVDGFGRSRFKWMKNTVYKTVLLMHPQERNVHGNIFGGYLMKVAMELSWVTAMCFVGTNYPVFLSADKIEFMNPVSIGAIMEFTGRVVYAANDKFVVQVLAHNVNRETNEKTATNKLTYVYQASASPESGSVHDLDVCVDAVRVFDIVPQEYEECIAYIEGRRAMADYNESRSANL